MRKPVDEEALRRLDERAHALEQRTAPPQASMPHSQAVSQAYRIVAELFGGVLLGLALGFGVDRLLGTTPWGLIGGVLLGFAVSVFMARRTANRLMALALAEQAAQGSVPAPGRAPPAASDRYPGEEDEER
jgi:ATP synthase protein I